MIYLTSGQIERINVHAVTAYPNECCGAVLGTFSGVACNASRTVLDIFPIDNQFDENEKFHRFKITPKDFLKCEKKARELNCDLIGFYHSHPDHPAKPSQYDLEHAFPVYSYLIVSVENGEPKKLTSWILADDRREFTEEPTYHT
ncbi:MAG: M67 family metallopeptidase [Planctomycetaceae bacterium]|jgi:proteasome lid subunit RPN8/RPN11|nr:M67 family metallopeptidase [Planctomycetaceae bacterium]